MVDGSWTRRKRRDNNGRKWKVRTWVISLARKHNYMYVAKMLRLVKFGSIYDVDQIYVLFPFVTETVSSNLNKARPY